MVIKFLYHPQHHIAGGAHREAAQSKSKGKSVSHLRLHFFSERLVNRWNQLLGNVPEASLLNSFKARLQKAQTMEIGFFMDTGSV